MFLKVMYLPKSSGKQVRNQIEQLRSLLDYYAWERYERSHPLIYGSNSNTTVFL